jgi:hypothetical protein
MGKRPARVPRRADQERSMKRFVLACAALAAAVLLSQQAVAADWHGPRKARQHAYKSYKAPKPPAWVCYAPDNCHATWGWGEDADAAPLAAVIVARGPVPTVPYYNPYYACQKPRPTWNGWRWVKVWDASCVGR